MLKIPLCINIVKLKNTQRPRRKPKEKEQEPLHSQAPHLKDCTQSHSREPSSVFPIVPRLLTLLWATSLRFQTHSPHCYKATDVAGLALSFANTNTPTQETNTTMSLFINQETEVQSPRFNHYIILAFRRKDRTQDWKSKQTQRLKEN